MTAKLNLTTYLVISVTNPPIVVDGAMTTRVGTLAAFSSSQLKALQPEKHPPKEVSSDFIPSMWDYQHRDFERPSEERNSSSLHSLGESLDMHSLSLRESSHTSSDYNVDAMIMAGSLQLQQHCSADSGLSGSQSSLPFALQENFYHEPADEYGFRSSSAASTNSAPSTNRYNYERLSYDQSPSIEALSSLRLHSHDSGVGSNGPGLHFAGDHRTTTSSGHSSRHARRLYVGGIPPSRTSEEMLQHFLNDVCSKCLEEENDHSYVLSVYMNHKKCFAFVELKTIELTSACLNLDGIVYFSNILRIQRAKEYRPELMINVPVVPIHFNLSKAPFPNKTFENLMDKTPPTVFYGEQIGMSEHQPFLAPEELSFVRTCAMSEILRGSIVIVGFPYDEGARRANMAPGSALGPRIIRLHLHRLFGSDPEYDFDWRSEGNNIDVCDVGDIPSGLVLEEALARLSESVAIIIQRGGIPLVLGGSGDMSFANASGLMMVAGGNVGIVSINSRLDVSTQRSEHKMQANSTSRLILSDTRFSPPREGLKFEQSCEGKYVHMAAQGNVCTSKESKFVEDRGGKIIWLSRDLRQKSNPYALRDIDIDRQKQADQVVKYSLDSQAYDGSSLSSERIFSVFNTVLSDVKGENHKNKRPIYLSFHLEALHSANAPGVCGQTYDGISSEEAIGISRMAGADSNVALFDLCGINPDIESSMTPLLAAQMAYSFILGCLHRKRKDSPPPSPTVSSQDSSGTSTDNDCTGLSHSDMSRCSH